MYSTTTNNLYNTTLTVIISVIITVIITFITTTIFISLCFVFTDTIFVFILHVQVGSIARSRQCVIIGIEMWEESDTK